jgi:Uma2 family endonuclease
MIVQDITLTEALDKEDSRILKGIKTLPTEDDLPYDDGVPMETARHRDQIHILIESLKTYWGKSRRYYVGGNMFLHYELKPKRKFRGPDFYLALDVDDRERKSWVVWQEGMRFPDVIIELMSKSTRKTDKVVKKELYEHTFKTAEYFLYDPFNLEFFGYRLVNGRYKLLWPDRDDKIYSVMTGLYLIVNDNQLRWMTEEGKILPTPMELAELQKQRADDEEIRADYAEIRASYAEIRASYAEIIAEQERQRAEEAELKLKQAQELLEIYQRQSGNN